MKLTRNLLIGFGVGLVVVIVLILGTLVTTKGGHLTLEGKVMKVRTLATDDKNSIAIVDFRVHNAAGIPFMSREAKVIVTKADGTTVEGQTTAKTDLDRVFDYYKILDPSTNPVLIQRDRVKAGETMDRMVAALIELPESEYGAAQEPHRAAV